MSRQQTSVADAQSAFDKVSQQVTALESEIKTLTSNISHATSLMDSGGHLDRPHHRPGSWGHTHDQITQWQKRRETAESEKIQKGHLEGKALSTLMVAKYVRGDREEVTEGG